MSQRKRIPLAGRASTAMELLRFLWDAKLWWIIPLVLTVFVLGGLVFLSHETPLAPLIYAIF
jgi:hypothetical protein